MAKARLKNAIYRYLEQRGEPASINQICDEFARRKGCMSATGMGSLLKSDRRFRKISGGEWYLTKAPMPMSMPMSMSMKSGSIWVISILINLVGIWENIRVNVSSIPVLALNITLTVFCAGMLFRNQIKRLFFRSRP